MAGTKPYFCVSNSFLLRFSSPAHAKHCFWPSILKMRCLREPEASWFIPGSWRWVIYSWWGMKRLHIAEPAANGGIARGRWSNWGMGRGSCWPVYSPGVSQYSGHVWSWVRMTDNPKRKKKKFKIIFYFFSPPPPRNVSIWLWWFLQPCCLLPGGQEMRSCLMLVFIYYWTPLVLPTCFSRYSQLTGRLKYRTASELGTSTSSVPLTPPSPIMLTWYMSACLHPSTATSAIVSGLVSPCRPPCWWASAWPFVSVCGL